MVGSGCLLPGTIDSRSAVGATISHHSPIHRVFRLCTDDTHIGLSGGHIPPVFIPETTERIFFLDVCDAEPLLLPAIEGAYKRCFADEWLLMVLHYFTVALACIFLSVASGWLLRRLFPRLFLNPHREAVRQMAQQ